MAPLTYKLLIILFVKPLRASYKAILMWVPNLDNLNAELEAYILYPAQFWRDHPCCTGQSLVHFDLFCIVPHLYESRIFVFVSISTYRQCLIISIYWQWLYIFNHKRVLVTDAYVLHSSFTANFSSETAWVGHPGCALSACQHAALWEQAGLFCVPWDDLHSDIVYMNP